MDTGQLTVQLGIGLVLGLVLVVMQCRVTITT